MYPWPRWRSSPHGPRRWGLPMSSTGPLATPARLVAALALATAVAFAGLAAPQRADAAGRENVRSIAYACLINKHGGWSGPVTNRDPQPWVVSRILEAEPSHLRVTS